MLVKIIEDIIREQKRNDINLSLLQFKDEEQLFDKIDKLGISKEDIVKKIKSLSDLDYVDLRNEKFDEGLKNIFKTELLYDKGYLPFKIEGKKLYIVTYKLIDMDRKSLSEFFKKHGYIPIFLYAFKFQIDKFLYKKRGKAEIKDIEGVDVSNFVEEIIKKAIDNNASDIHIEPQKEIIRIRYRIDGVLLNMMEIKKDENFYTNLISKIKILSNMDIAENRKPQDGRINDFMHNSLTYDIRVSTVNTIFGEKVVLRILNKDGEILTFEELGFEKEEEESIKEILDNKSGIVLLAGATGSGKSTTLYTMIDWVNEEGVNISTIEDPVERDVPGINQVQVSNYVSYVEILRSFLRQDPDIIIVGEIRDEEVAELAIRSAMTGHLVLATIHAKNIQEIPVRLEDMGIKRYLIANTSVGYISQRLVRKICNHCKVEYMPSDRERKWLERMSEKYPEIKLPDKFYKGQGCEECNYTGYKGRTAVVEVLNLNDDDREKILNGSKLNRFNSMEKIAFKKVVAGITTVHEVLKVI